MKRILTILLIAVLAIATVNAQTRTTRRTQTMSTTTQAITRVASPIQGTWYLTRKKHISFRADGTTDYGGFNKKYQYLPEEGQIIVSKDDGSERQVLIVLKLTSDQLMLSADGTNFTTYDKQRPPQPVTGITLSQSSIQLRKNGTAKIVATIEPADADNQNLIWTSSNKYAVTVKKEESMLLVMAKLQFRQNLPKMIRYSLLVR